MKATLEFDLPEDRMEHERAVHATYAFLALFEFDNALRNLIKHPGEGVNEKFIDGLDHARNLLREKMDDEGVSLEMLE